jgi:hypothetical protein
MDPYRGRLAEEKRLVDEYPDESVWKRGGKLSPVSKRILVGSRGGLYYYNEKGNKIHLNKRQRKQCLLQGGVTGERNQVCKYTRIHDNTAFEAPRSSTFIPNYGGVFLEYPS